MDWNSFTVWGMISCVHFLCCHTFPWSASPSHTGYCQKPKLSPRRKMKHFNTSTWKPHHSFGNCACGFLLWWIDKGRTVGSLNYFLDNSGSSRRLKMQEAVISLAVPCLLTLVQSLQISLKSEAFPVKWLKFCLLILWSVKFLCNFTSG